LGRAHSGSVGGGAGRSLRVCHSGCIWNTPAKNSIGRSLCVQRLPQLDAHLAIEGINSGGRDLGDEMFSRQSHVRDDDDIIGADEAFRWTEDEVVTERRRNRALRKRIGLSFVGALGLTVLIVGIKVSMGLH
jgi:hypothetical protein